MARGFLWGRSSTNSGFHSVGCSVTTLKKSEGGLGIRNLRLAQHSLMAKNVFDILNSVDKLWVSIFNFKYAEWKIWNPVKPKFSSWFYHSICRTANYLKPNLKMITCNPNFTDLWNDACIFDLPISQKPTYLNMTLNLENFQFRDLIDRNGFCLDSLTNIFGNEINWDDVNKRNICFDNKNFWIWNQRSFKTSIAFSVYEHLCRTSGPDDLWTGWAFIWKLRVIPRVKTFIWKLAHGKLPTGALLYHLNIGPFCPCPLCGLCEETSDHLLWKCGKVVHCWMDLFSKLNLNSDLLNSLSTGVWLDEFIFGRVSSSRVQALIATVAWLIWKQRCNLIFNNCVFDASSIVPRAWSLCSELDVLPFRECSSRSLNCTISIFTNASWTSSTSPAGMGFLIVANLTSILVAGSSGAKMDSPFMAELAAINRALQICKDFNWVPDRAFCDCPGIPNLLKNYNPCVTWHVHSEFINLKLLLNHFPNVHFNLIARDDNAVADALASFGRSNVQLSLFFQGLERPFWLDDICTRFNLSF
ncbi:uncharacterized protein LOC120273306 [Dioscorea cayenensis subsp. rotundata]|uniref:Uncharacterized protein LOC120273306 n=1 Tax=Dioscorea cayennensis subsp. rotundata TaxID=55577 RepID=A0AB40C7P1_DIOCR|nr:uncharacterized protein LOC120273306 [Dioscorea cayenensis subsp. rotundata]